MMMKNVASKSNLALVTKNLFVTEGLWVYYTQYHIPTRNQALRVSKAGNLDLKKKCFNLQTYFYIFNLSNAYLFFPDQFYSIIFSSCTVWTIIEVLGR